jgi:kynurenine formamidase
MHAEKLANLDKLPPFGFKISLFPIKIEKASGAWIRAVAYVPE